MKTAESIIEYVELIHDHRIRTGRNWIIEAFDKALQEAYLEGEEKGRAKGIHEAVEACAESAEVKYLELIIYIEEGMSHFMVECYATFCIITNNDGKLAS